jgi:hypothetical protein
VANAGAIDHPELLTAYQDWANGLPGRLAWWARQPGSAPLLLDVFDLDDAAPGPGRVQTGARLLRTGLASVLPAGARLPDYSRFVPPGWRDDPLARRGIEDRMAAWS